MEMYVAWYTGDPEFQAIDANCNVLVDLTSVSKKWTCDRWRFMPLKMIISSGKSEKREDWGLTSPEKVLENQTRILSNFEGNAFFCYPDIPLKKVSAQQAEKIYKQNIENAKTYYAQFKQYQSNFPNAKPLGIVHGYDAGSILNATAELENIGYKYFALGSQEIKSRLNRGSIASFIKLLLGKVKYLHILGVTSVDLFSGYLKELGASINSIDSSTPVKEAFTNGFYFSKPTGRFKVCTERLNINWIREWGYAKLVCSPFRTPSCKHECEQVEDTLKHRIVNHKDLPRCKCPVCKKYGTAEGLLRVGKKIYNNRRAVHSYFHLKKEFEEMLENPFEERVSCSDFIP
jgi:queuine/archaeosine tRNA-ribosyltransferase